MPRGNEPDSNPEQIYQRLSKFPTKPILLPALKVGALAGKRLSFDKYTSTNDNLEVEITSNFQI